MGFEFPSIAKMNLTLSIEGLVQDLNHHIRPYQRMAQITLADWSCSLNNCNNPLETKMDRNFMRFYNNIPVAWLEAQQGLQKLGVNLHKTDLSFISTGEVSISHILKIKGQGENLHRKTLSAFQKRGIYGRVGKPQCNPDDFINTQK